MNSNPLRKQIVDKADIVNIISQYVKLEKKGNNYIGLCPFHDDKNPSMSVSPQKKVFKCFSCGTAGDVVSFVSKIKNISISDALREVGASVGIKVALTQKDIERQKNTKYYNVLKEANDFFNFYLLNTVEGKNGIQYLQNRKISLDEIKRFQIGLAGEDDILYKTLSQKGYLPLDMIEVGVLRGGDFYHDAFKNRIIFPIKDLEGNVVGFSGRKYLPKQEDESKYINTNETIVFKKGEILYNYSESIQEIKMNNNVYLFEGFMDVIAAYKANITNSVASMGTALTVKQINAIKRITKNVTLCYDSDGPGVLATIKAIELLVSNDMNVNVAIIPEGKDADEYIFNNGSEALNKCLKNNLISGIEFLYNQEKKNLDLNNVNSIEEFKNKIFKYLNVFKSNIITEKTVKQLSIDLKVSYENLISDFNNNKNNISIQHYDEKDLEEVNKIITDQNNKSNSRFIYAQQKYLKSERMLLLAALNDKKNCYEIENLLENHFYNEINRNILYKLLSYYKMYDIMNEEIFIQRLDYIEKETLLDIKNKETMPSNTEIISLVKNIKKWPYDKAINRINNKEEKETDDLIKLSEYKRKTIIINKNKE